MSKEQKNKKQTKKNESSERDQFTAVLEDIRSQFQVFGEGMGFVSDKLDKHTEQLEGLTDRMGNVETKVDNIETDLEFVKNELGLIRHNQVTRDEFKFLESRVARLERKI